MAAPPPVSADSLASLSRVLDAIRIDGCSSRADVATSTGLAKALVTERLRTLIDRGLVSEGDVMPSQGGRRARSLSMAASGGHALALEMGMRHLSAALVDLSGHIRGRRSIAFDLHAGPTEVCAAGLGLLREFEGTEPHLGTLLGVGVGIAAPVEFATGRTINPPVTPNWHNFSVRDYFSAALGVQTWVDNEVNLAALAESRKGAVVGHDNALVFKLGSWTGAGLVSNGKLHRGAQGCAGSLATQAGRDSLVRAATALATSGQSGGLADELADHGQLSVELVTKVADAGDSAAAGLLDDAATEIGRIMSVVVEFFNPSLVVLSGGMAHGGERFLGRVRETVYGSSISLATRDLQIVGSLLDDDAGVLGAGILALDAALSPEGLIATFTHLHAE